MIDPPAIPEGHTLLHVGFAKTGTTALQSALSSRRDELLRQGVRYPGRETQHKTAAVGLMGVRGRIGDRPASLEDWNELVREVRSAREQRVAVSSEWLAEATDDQARKAIHDLGGETVDVVATIRPLGRILPSSWQQYIQNGIRVGYGRWLRGMLLEPPYDRPTPSFWRRHRHDAVLARWAAMVGPERVTLIVLDSRDRERLLRQFECLLALRPGTLQVTSTVAENRSLSRPEIELIRRLNREFHRQQLPDELYRELIRRGLVPALSGTAAPRAGLPSIATPQWALDRAAELGAEMTANIRTLGVNVVGDLEELAAPLTALPQTGGSNSLPPDLAAIAVLSAVEAGKRVERLSTPVSRTKEHFARSPRLRRIVRAVRRR